MDMDEKAKSFRLIVKACAAVVITLIVVAGGCDMKETHTALSNGYERVSVPGVDCPQWQKVK